MNDIHLDELTAISPADGRYRSKLTDLAPLVSEFGLIRYRVHVECEWLLWLPAVPGVSGLPALDESDIARVRRIHDDFSPAEAAEVKDLERTTNHDVKAVEYFVKDRIRAIDALREHVEYVHFACTSEDINNLAYGLMLRDARDLIILPQTAALTDTIAQLASSTARLPMLSRTHGQPASPTTLGKELRNVTERLSRQREQIAAVRILGKKNGAVGNFNAHTVAYPELDWPGLSAAFVTHLGLVPNPYTTQIEPHDYIAEFFHALSRFNQVLLDFDRDVWNYIAIEYFTQKTVEGETGSSTMPHKVNPIDFENSEGNVGLANALLEHMAGKLPVSRWQRDLSDSTVLRSMGAALAHCAIAYQATLKGLSRLRVNEAAILADLDANWEVLGEAVQTVMRKHGMHEPYEQLKSAIRGRRLDESLYQEILDTLNLPPAARAELEGLTPASYIGLAAELAEK